MRTTAPLLAALVCVLSTPALAGAPDHEPGKQPAPMGDVVSEVYSTSGSPSELATRAQRCISQVVRFDGPESGKSVIASVVLEAGTVVANSRLDVRHGMMQSLVQSTLTFEAREGRFRMVHAGVTRAQRIAGTGAPFSQFEPVGVGSFSERVTAAMKERFGRIAECVMSKTADF